MQVFRSAKAEDMLGIPEHRDQGLSVVGDKSRFVSGIKRCQFGNDLWIVDDHRWKSFLSGSTCLGMVALTVIMGSLTTWLKRSFMATLHSR